MDDAKSVLLSSIRVGKDDAKSVWTLDSGKTQLRNELSTRSHASSPAVISSQALGHRDSVACRPQHVVQATIQPPSQLLLECCYAELLPVTAPVFSHRTVVVFYQRETYSNVDKK